MFFLIIAIAVIPSILLFLICLLNISHEKSREKASYLNKKMMISQDLANRKLLNIIFELIEDDLKKSSLSKEGLIDLLNRKEIKN